MEAILVSLLVCHARMCQRLIQAVGYCSSRSVVASCSSRAVGTVPVRHFRSHSTFFPSLQPAGIVRHRFHRALMQSEFLGTQFRSLLPCSIALARIQQPGLASIWTCSRHAGRSAEAITSPDQSRKMSSGNKVARMSINMSCTIRMHKLIMHALWILQIPQIQGFLEYSVSLILMCSYLQS